MATGKYSQAIFKKLNFEVLHELNYEGFIGKDGTDFFKNMQEHKGTFHVLIPLTKRFSQRDFSTGHLNRVSAVSLRKVFSTVS